jgi:mannose-6-phosphate isomerase-like protein (cupin superfamily)
MAETQAAYRILRLSSLEPVHCLCGWSHRLISQPDRPSFHVVDIDAEARKHYHRTMTEFYYILDGEGSMELNDDVVPVAVGDLIELPPGVRHRALGKLRVLVVALPGFNRQDEHFD